MELFVFELVDRREMTSLTELSLCYFIQQGMLNSGKINAFSDWLLELGHKPPFDFPHSEAFRLGLELMPSAFRFLLSPVNYPTGSLLSPAWYQYIMRPQVSVIE